MLKSISRRALMAGMAIGLASAGARAKEFDGIAVEASPSFIVHESDQYRCWFPALFQLDENTLVVAVQTHADEVLVNMEPPFMTISRDAGRTWSRAERWKTGDNGISWLRRKDGTYLWLAFRAMYQSDTVAVCNTGRSSDGLRYEWTEGTIDLSNGPVRFETAAHGTASLVFHRSIIELPDGSLLASMYGRCENDAEELDRCIMVVSTDGGYNWKYLSTMGWEPSVGDEGLNEPVVVTLANGDLFCLMRNGWGVPMYATRSSDGGKTWTSPRRLPEETAALSVDPDLLLLSNGILMCTAGRQKETNDNLVMFSLDGKGETWTAPTTIFTGRSTCYATIRQTGENEVFMLYDYLPVNWEEPKRGEFQQIRGSILTLKPTVAP